MSKVFLLSSNGKTTFACAHGILNSSPKCSSTAAVLVMVALFSIDSGNIIVLLGPLFASFGAGLCKLYFCDLLLCRLRL